MSATRFLIIAAVLLLLVWSTSASGLLRGAPALVANLAAAVFVLAAVRLGLSMAIIAFDLSPLSYLIPISMGIVAWWLRPRWRRRGAS